MRAGSQPKLRAAALLLFEAVCPLIAADSTPEQIEFFETRIRPVLTASCYPCHGPAVAPPMGELRVDSREMLLRGGKSGPALTPGNPETSRLWRAITYQESLKMPPSGKLSDAQISDLAAWIKMGAPDATGAHPNAKNASRDFWAFQSVRQPPVRRSSAVIGCSRPSMHSFFRSWKKPALVRLLRPISGH
jgi:Planctomycete cytochrome C